MHSDWPNKYIFCLQIKKFFNIVARSGDLWPPWWFLRSSGDFFVFSAEKAWIWLFQDQIPYFGGNCHTKMVWWEILIFFHTVVRFFKQEVGIFSQKMWRFKEKVAILDMNNGGDMWRFLIGEVAISTLNFLATVQHCFLKPKVNKL